MLQAWESMFTFERGMPIPRFDVWLLEQRESLLNAPPAAGAMQVKADHRLFKHERDSGIHKDLMEDIDAEISKDGIWPPDRIKLFCSMVSNALVDGIRLEDLREKVYVFEEPLAKFVDWLEDQIAWLEDAPTREAKRNASWFLPLPQQRTEKPDNEPAKVPIVE